MNELTIMSVQKAINNHLNKSKKHLNDSTIYMEKVEEKLNLPAIYVKNLTNSSQIELSDRRKRIHSFDVQYFPVFSNRMTYDALSVADKLMQLLEKVPFYDSYMRGLNITTEYIGGILHCMVDYEIQGQYEREKLPKMENLEQNRRIKNEEDRG